MSYVLWLASWYPCKLTPFDGDFIQRHARATALFEKITVIHVKKDEHRIITDDVKENISTSKNLTEIIVYYHSYKTGFNLFDRILSTAKYKKTYRAILKKHINKNGAPLLVHVHVAMKAGLPALYLKQKLNIRYLLTEHWSGFYAESPQNIYNSGWLFKKLSKAVVKNASIVLPVAKSLEIAIKKIENVECKIIPNVVNTILFFYNQKEIQKFRFIHPSSMNYAKNPDGIMRAAKLLANDGIRFELLMIGNKDAELRNIASSLEILDKYIFFKDAIPYEQIAVEMQSSSALVMFSRIESLPCVILEAQCCGLPVISSNVGSIKEIVNNTNGILVESENEFQLKEAMKKVISDYKFYNRKIIAEKAMCTFSYATVGKQISDIYKR